MIKKKDGVHSQFRMTRKARDNAQKFKDRLRRYDIPMRLGDVINLLLEKTTMAEFERHAEGLIRSQSAMEKLRKMHREGKIDDAQLEALLENVRRRNESDSENESEEAEK